ncbi:histone H1/5 [Sarotherodon galilaeus]
MDPAAFSPPRELQEAVIDSASKLINQWLEHEGEASLYTVEANLQHLISGYPWLLDSLHPLVQNFVLHELHLHPPATTARPLASMEDVLSDLPDEELPGPSEPSPRRKRRSRRRRGTPQPDVGTCKQSAVVSERDTFSSASDSVTVFSGAIFCVPSEVNNDFSVSPMAIAPKTAFAEPTFRVNDCVHAVVSKPGVTEFSTISLENENVWDPFSSALVYSGEAINFTETVFPDHIPPSTPSPQFQVGSVTQLAVQLAVQSAATLPSVQSAATLPSVQSATPPPITPPLQSSPLPIAQLPRAQQPTHSFIQSPSSPSHYKQGTHFIITSAGSLKLAISGTVAPSRASPEAGCQSPANSGPLEVKTPAPAASLENFTEQSQPSSPAESSSEFALLPPSSAGCIGEHFQPSEDCIPLLLPESSHCAAQSQPVSTLPEVFVPAASVSVSTGGPKEPVQSQATSAGGSGEPSQRPTSSAGGPESPAQPHASSAGGPESPAQPHASSAGGPESPAQPHASSAGGSEEPIQHYALSAGGLGGPSQHILMSADGPGKSVQPSPAESPPAASTSPPAASTSPGSAAVPSAFAWLSLRVFALCLRLVLPRLVLRFPHRHRFQLVLYHLASAGRFPDL